eukprot:XP_017169549.1 PREDICTED: histocompatibility antigen 60b isoform X2 [Mus musculus]
MAKSSLSLNWSLLVLLNFLGATLSTGTDSLSCELTFNHRTLHGQCSVNGKTLLDFGDKKHEGNATEMCADLSQSLRELSEGMRNQQSESKIKVLDTTQNTNTTQIHPTVNNSQHNSDTQGLSFTWIVIICIGGIVSFMAFMVFAWCMLKKKKGALCCSSSSTT